MSMIFGLRLSVVCFCFFSSSVIAVDVQGKVHTTISCLAPPGVTKETWGEEEQLAFVEIGEFLEKNGLDFEDLSPVQLDSVLKMVDPALSEVRNHLVIMWAGDNDDENYITDSLARLDTLLWDSSISTSQYLGALNLYNVLAPFSLDSEERLKAAKKRTDLSRDQMFYVDARLAMFFGVKNNGLDALENLIKIYPDNRQCVAICGEQMALTCRSNVEINNPQKAFDIYSRVFVLCPEMLGEVSSLLGYAVICRESEKAEVAIKYLLDYADANPSGLETPEVLQMLANIYIEDLKDYEKAIDTYKRIVACNVPDTEEMREFMERAKVNMQSIMDRLERDGDYEYPEHGPITPAQWSTWRITSVVLGIVFIILSLLLRFFDFSKKDQ
jgi:tetratricopeptide (TPR) repeat protein